MDFNEKLMLITLVNHRWMSSTIFQSNIKGFFVLISDNLMACLFIVLLTDLILSGLVDVMIYESTCKFTLKSGSCDKPTHEKFGWWILKNV